MFPLAGFSEETSSSDYYSPDAVAELLGLHVRTVRRYIREGRLNAARIGKQYRIAATDLRAFVGPADQAPVPPRRTRAVRISTIVDADAISREESNRLTRAVTAAAHADGSETAGRHVECLYYEEQANLRIIVNGDTDFVTSTLRLIGHLLDEARQSV